MCKVDKSLEGVVLLNKKWWLGRLLMIEGVLKRGRGEGKVCLGKWLKFVLGRNCKLEVENFINFSYELVEFFGKGLESWEFLFFLFIVERIRLNENGFSFGM